MAMFKSRTPAKTFFFFFCLNLANGRAIKASTHIIKVSTFTIFASSGWPKKVAKSLLTANKIDVITPTTIKRIVRVELKAFFSPTTLTKRKYVVSKPKINNTFRNAAKAKISDNVP